MGACCSRKKKSSSKSVRRTGDYESRKKECERREGECERREEECERRDEECKRKEEAQNRKLRRKGIFRHLNKNPIHLEEEGDPEGHIGFRNNSYKDGVCRHNFLEYKLRSVKKKYESKNNNSTPFNPFSEEEKYPNSLNPFYDEEYYPPGYNPFENTETSCNSSEICPGACRNHDDEIESPEVNSAPQSPLMATEADSNDSNVEVLDSNEDDNFYNIENDVEDSGDFASPEGNSKSTGPMMAKEAESDDTKVKFLGYNEDALRDLRYLYVPEYEVANIGISEIESCLVTENENKTSMIDILKEDNVTEKFNDQDMFNNKTPVDDTASYSKINQISKNENTSHCLITSASNVPPAVKRKSLKKYKAPAPPVLPTLPSKIESYLIKENEKLSKMYVNREEKELVKEFSNEQEKEVSTQQDKNNHQVKHSSSNSEIHNKKAANNNSSVASSSNADKYNSQFLTSSSIFSPLQLNNVRALEETNSPISSSSKGYENISKISTGYFKSKKLAPEPPKSSFTIQNRIHLSKNQNSPTTPKSTGLQQEASKNNYRISRPAPAPPVPEPLQPQQGASKNNYRISRPAPAPPVPEPLQPQQGASKNKYRISRPAPAPPVPEPLQPIRTVADTTPETKLIPTKEYRRKDRRKSLMDLFKVKKKKKKNVDMV